MPSLAKTLLATLPEFLVHLILVSCIILWTAVSTAERTKKELKVEIDKALSAPKKEILFENGTGIQQ